MLGYVLTDRVKRQSYDKERAIVSYDRRDFKAGVSVAVLEPSEAPLTDILRCHLVHSQVYQNSKITAPMLYWVDGWLVCCCRETELLDKYGYGQVFPYFCFSRMAEFKTEIVVPSCKPETSVPVLRVVPSLLRDSFSSTIENVVKRKKETKP